MVQQRDPVTKVGDELVLTVPSMPAFVATARLFAAAVARHAGCTEEAVEDVKIATSEAVTNAVKAHRESAIDEVIRILARPEGDSILFEIVDSGPGFDVHQRSDEQFTPPSGLYEGSLGLSLIRSLFANAEFVRNDGDGMTVRFRVSIDGDALEMDQ